MERERPGASGPEARVPEAWIGREVMIETTEALSTDLRAADPVRLEDVNDRGAVVLVTRYHEHSAPHRYFYPWGVVGWMRLGDGAERGPKGPP